jgi:N-acetylglucosamine malate deacetylase 1
MARAHARQLGRQQLAHGRQLDQAEVLSVPSSDDSPDAASAQSPQRVLVVAPHPDDESIGPGGTIADHRAAGYDVCVVFLTSGERSHPHLPSNEVQALRESEAQAAASVLGISILAFLRLPDQRVNADVSRSAAALAQAIAGQSFHTIYLPHPDEDHPDHAAALSIVEAALPPSASPWLLGYEVWTPMRAFDHVVDITAHLPVKLEAIRAYASQLAQFDYVRAVSGLNQYRGALACKSEFAEVFCTLNR